MTIRTRFAPSPTGYMHLGNVRTALFNYLLARHHKGAFLLRIEDTDKERHNEDAVEVIYNGLKWLGLDWDEEPVRQSLNIERHKSVVHELIENGKAYACYLSDEEAEKLKEQARNKNIAFKSPWRDEQTAQSKGFKKADRKPVYRLKTPVEGSQVLADKIQGDVEVENDQIEDFVLLRADETPTYMLSVVVDDHDMKITHVVRGDDHLTNTFKQLLIYKAMEWDLPNFAHMPMILGEDGKKLSKRKGALGLHDYMDAGYLPDAFCNYLMRLGWSYGDEEIISMDQAIEWFTLAGVNKSSAQINPDKLNFLNAHYIKETDAETLYAGMEPYLLKQEGIVDEETLKRRVILGMDGLRDRGETLKELAEQAHFYAKKRPLPVTSDAAPILDADARKNLASLIEALKLDKEFTAESVQETLKQFVNDQGLKFKDVGMPLRVALTGTKSSPSTNEIAAALGQEETIKRLEDVVMNNNIILESAA
ncbi:MAG: glutamate--tRNA ligase [Rickettsiales bacterium]|nr:glutamate--tRNA ligase [Rickettsiales bacterium]|tara:strand:- start:3186 stop:4622 length:1437 start_codon:yes stop_codon:yes gene_type:complete